MRDVGSDIAAILEAAGIGLTTGVNLWIGQMPDAEDTADLAVAVMQTGGNEPEPFVGGGRRVMLSPSCQVRVRGNREDYREAKQLALACASALNEISPAPYVRISLTESAPFFVGMDSADRPIWTLHVEAQYVDDGSTPPMVALANTALAASRVTVSPVTGLTATDAQAALAEHQGDIDALQGSLDVEAASRADADDLLDGRVAATEAGLVTEQTTRAAADTALDGRVGANEADIASLLTQLAAAVLTSGDQSVDGVKTFLQALLVAGAIKGTAADGSTAVGIVLDTVNELATSGAKLLSVRRAGVEKFSVNNDGWIRSGGWVGAQLFTGLGFDLIRYGSNGSTNIGSETVDGAGAIAVKIGSGRPLSAVGAKLASFQNAGAQRSTVDKDGAYEVPTAGGYILIAKSPNGTRYGVSVANDGTLITTPL